MWEKRQIPLTEGRTVLGRAPDAGAWIDAPGISRHHARITMQGSHATLEDLGSKNGTYLRGERITEPVALSDGDQIRLGSVVITFRIPPPADRNRVRALHIDRVSGVFPNVPAHPMQGRVRGTT